MLACGEIGFRWLTPIAYILYGILYLGMASYSIALSGDFSSRVFQNSDSAAAILLNVVIAALAAMFPIETLTRYAQVIMLILVPLFLALSSTMFMEPEWRWLQPIFVLKDMIHPMDALAVVMCIFSPLATITLLNRTRSSISFLALCIYMALLALITSSLVVLSLTTFGLHTAKKLEYLVFYAQNAIYVENFIFERFFYTGGILLIYFKIVGSAFLIRCAALCMAHTFGYKLGAFPILAIGAILAGGLWRMNLPVYFHIAPLWLGYYSMILFVALPLLIYILLLLKGTRT